MKEKIKALYARYGDILRYLIIGGLTTLLDMGVFALLHAVLGVHMQVANVITWVVAVAFAFVGNKWLVFRTDTKDRRELLREGVSFVSMRLLTLLFSAAFLEIAVKALGWDELVAKAVSTVLVVILNYVLSRLVVFRQKKQ